MMRRLLFWISSRLPCRIIADNGIPYLERYHVLALGSWRIYLHRFVGDDPDRGVHDHPWAWAFSLVLSGFYLEERRRDFKYSPVRWFNYIGPDTFHRVMLPSGRNECWTLFVHGKRVKGWGFMAALVTVPLRVFLHEPFKDSEQRLYRPHSINALPDENADWHKRTSKGRNESRRQSL